MTYIAMTLNAFADNSAFFKGVCVCVCVCVCVLYVYVQMLLSVEVQVKG